MAVSGELEGQCHSRGMLTAAPRIFGQQRLQYEHLENGQDYTTKENRRKEKVKIKVEISGIENKVTRGRINNTLNGLYHDQHNT